MKLNFPGLFCGVILLLWLLPTSSIAQPGASVQLDKPKKFENRTLASEKSTEGKFNPVKKANQNLNTRYNFVFNSERILNEVLTGARFQFRDDFSKLLPFYNYTLDNTADQAQDLDSVLMKCNDAILLHDLRNDWVDDLYLMMGKAYFFKKNFDSAAIAFQYVNFAFQPRNKDEIGYNKAIGSNANTTGNVYTISTKEKGDIVSTTLGHPPARNESILWLARTKIEQKSYNDAWSIIATLNQDVNFPSRLKNDLNELKAYWYYQQNILDSSSFYLSRALDNATNIQEKSRWEYLVAQMLETSHKNDEAYKFYDKSITHTTDPVMEAYARINQIRLITGEDEQKRIAMNIAELMKMAKKDKYEEYRHIIYYAAAQMELKRNQPAQAIEYLKLSAKYNLTDPAFKAKSWLLLADLAYESRMYPLADFGYDSLDISDPSIPDPETTQNRKYLAGEVVGHMENIRIEDSLIRLAAMPEQERNSYVKALVKKLRKEKGLKEEENAAVTSTVDTRIAGVDDNQQVPDLFAGNTNKGEWYFYNSSLRAQGLRQFKVTWGNRPNVDNWRRAKGMNVQQPEGAGTLPDVDASQGNAAAANNKAQPNDLTVEALSQNIPLTPEMLKASNDTIAYSMYALGKLFREKIGDCESLIKYGEELLNRYPTSPYTEETLFGLYYCQEKAGNKEKAAFYKDYMAKHFNQSRFLRMINEPAVVEKESKQLQVAATTKYEEIYNSFIEGDFNKALAEKKKADSLYGENYWSPQLLYIESIYYVKTKQDSLAIGTLKNLMALYHESPMSAKAATMIEVLQKRAEIEDYLTKLNVERAKEDSVAVIEETVKVKPKEKVETTGTRPAEVKAPVNKGITRQADTTSFKAPVMEKKELGYTFRPADKHMVILLLDKVDIVYVNEARNALNRFNKEKYYSTPLDVTNVNLDENRKMVTISSFTNVVDAQDYMEKIKAGASSELFPWMPKDKFSFFVITAENLELLKNKKNLEEYLKLYKQSYSSKK